MSEVICGVCSTVLGAISFVISLGFLIEVIKDRKNR